MQDNIQHILVLQRELLVNSADTYPQIDWDAMIDFVDSVNQKDNELQFYKKVPRA